MKVLVTADYRTLSLDGAHIVAEAVRLKPTLTIGLPAGNTPTGMYEQLAAAQLDFSNVKTFNIDEYVGLRPDDVRSFHAYMRRTFFDHINLPPKNIHFPDEEYEQTIRAAGGIDLLVLGIGLNGHIAFNEPGSDLNSRTRIVDLAPETVAPVRRGITMGIATILEARRILLLASGSSKRAILRGALEGPVQESLPASALQLHSALTVIVDKAAASNAPP
jgi:glucosamine-6-phosphate deaminase